MTDASSSFSTLPEPRRSRWQPLRSGLLNLYRFDDEEFHYEDGHLLLRGNNGTGKSRILALQLPFLLDGDVSPYRLEPDGDPAKRIEWNLLLGTYAERLGYTWLELGRLDGDGETDQPARYLTLGCGLRAVEGRGLAGKWFFITEKRVGVDFSLVGNAGEALTRQRLEEVLGGDGEIFTAAADYRRAIDRRLFRLGEARYEALVRLLIQLRQPQLARKLDEELLSKALGDALPPLSEHILADVAEAFAGLESERQALADLRAAAQGADAFLGVYRRYAKALSRRRAEAVRSRHAEYESSQRRLRQAEATRDDAARRVAALGERQSRLEAERERLEVEVRTLESSPEMRNKQDLDAARRRAEAARRELERAAAHLESLRQDLQAGEERLDGALQDARARAARARRALDDARRAAAEAALEKKGSAAWATLDRSIAPSDEPDQPSTIETGQLDTDQLDTDQLEAERSAGEAIATLGALAEQRRRGLRLLRRLGEELARREDHLRSAREDHGRATAEVDRGVDDQRRAHDERDEAVRALLEAYAAWRAELRALEPSPAAELAEELDAWAREEGGPNPLAAAVEKAAERAREIVSRHLADIEATLGEERRRQGELEEQARELEAGAAIEPPASPTRDIEARRGRAGAPFWRLLDFREAELDAEARAVVEAALEASGLLDAWVTPAGELLDTADDALLTVADDDDEPAIGLGSVLRPVDEADASNVSRDVVLGLLRRIGWGEGRGRAWVAPSGRYRLGPLHGRWRKEAAQFIGEKAREQERRRRLEALRRQIEEADAALHELGREREQMKRQAELVRREVEAAPADDAVRDAAAAVLVAGRELTRLRQRQVEAERRLQERREARDDAREELDDAALDLGLGERLDELDTLEEAITVFDRRLAALEPELELYRSAMRLLAERRDEIERRRGQVEGAAEESEQAKSRTNRAEAERRALESSLGATVEALIERLEQARAALAERRGEIEAARREETRLQVEKARAEERIEAETEALDGHEASRREAADGLRSLAELRLLTIAAEELEIGEPAQWSITRTVEVARALESELRDVDAEQASWDRLQGRVHERFRQLTDTLLPHGYEPSLTTPAESIVVKVPFQGQPRDVDEFRGALQEETSTRDRVLAAREREILENHLLSEVSLHLHDCLRHAEELVREINAEIEERPMSTGMQLRFEWRPRSGEVEHLEAARRLLLTDHRMRSPEENGAIGRFLQARIEDQRESEDGGTWSDHLARALDYRAWHRFTIEQRQGGQWRRLTRRTHGTGSGGEKAIALTVPQFAAAAAHYRSARPEAPRLILLDEAFVGVDGDMRAKCMGLLAAFDLDFVMTSEREWGCYPTLPGLAIYQLATHPQIDAVGVTRWVWNGRERVRAETPRAEGAAQRSAEGEGEGESEPVQAEIFAAEPER